MVTKVLRCRSARRSTRETAPLTPRPRATSYTYTTQRTLKSNFSADQLG